MKKVPWLKGAYKSETTQASPKPGSRAARIAMVSQGKSLPGRVPRPSSRAVRYGGSS